MSIESFDSELPPAEVFPPGLYIAEEIACRRWTIEDLAIRMGGDSTLNACTLELLIFLHDRECVLDKATAEGLARAFGTSPELWLGLDEIWRTGISAA